MSRIEQCPHCGVDLRDGEPRDGRQYTKTFGFEIDGVYDGVLMWGCPACGWLWHRFEPGDRQYVLAAPYVRENNAMMLKEQPPGTSRERRPDRPAAPPEPSGGS